MDSVMIHLSLRMDASMCELNVAQGSKLVVSMMELGCVQLFSFTSAMELRLETSVSLALTLTMLFLILLPNATTTSAADAW